MRKVRGLENPDLAAVPPECRCGNPFPHRPAIHHCALPNDPVTTALRATQQRDHAAFARLYRLTARTMFRQCHGICRDYHATQDIVAEAYVSIWRNAGQWDAARGSALAWMSSIARHRAIDWRRGQLAQPFEARPLPDRADPAPDAETRLLSSEQAERLARCVDTLSAAQRDAIRLSFYGGLSYSEVADQTGVSLPTAKSWIRRGLQRMRADLDHDAEPLELIIGPTPA